MATIKKLFSIDEAIAQELEQVASALHTSQKDIVEKALDFYFDYTDGIIADSISKKIDSSEIKLHNSEDVYKELGIDI